MVEIINKNLVYPELSYKIIGCAFEVFNKVGSGHKESVYQNALKLSFGESGLNFKEQVYYPVTFNGLAVGRNYFDFLVDDKVIVEIKSISRFTKPHFDQALNYLRVSGLKLALLVLFGAEGVTSRRVVNFGAANSELP